MIQLKDYIGSLVAEMNNARAIADLKTKQIALAYAEDNVLKHFPIPHFRTSEVELTVPIALDQLTPTKSASSSIGDSKTFIYRTNAVLDTHYKITDNVKVSKRVMNITSTYYNTLTNKLEQGANTKEALQQYAESVIKETAPIYKEVASGRLASEKTLLSNLVKELTPLITVQQASDLYNSSIIFEAAKLQQLDTKSLIQIKIKMHESGMEWSRVENEDGTVNNTLIPE